MPRAQERRERPERPPGRSQCVAIRDGTLARGNARPQHRAGQRRAERVPSSSIRGESRRDTHDRSSQLIRKPSDASRRPSIGGLQNQRNRVFGQALNRSRSGHRLERGASPRPATPRGKRPSHRLHPCPSKSSPDFIRDSRRNESRGPVRSSHCFLRTSTSRSRALGAIS